MILQLACKSLKNRKTSALLTIFSIAVSVALLLSVERVRLETHNSFANTLSGTDIVVGARSSPINLLLYSVFHIGNATNNITWQTYQELSGHPAVKWTIPIALGDSHQGYRVVGTSSDMFKHFHYGDKQLLTLSDGRPFTDLYDAVIGSEVAAALGYSTNQQIVLSHGLSKTGPSLQQHGDKPFRVAGILQATGTPMDRVILVSLEAIEALHIDWAHGAPSLAAFAVSADKARSMDLQPGSITAAGFKQ